MYFLKIRDIYSTAEELIRPNDHLEVTNSNIDLYFVSTNILSLSIFLQKLNSIPLP